MKLNKKKVVVVSLALCLIAILSFGTLAWFNASDEVTNTFMVADSTDDPDELFSVDIYETAVEEDGVTAKDDDDDGEADVTDSGNTYDNIVPGKLYSKDPTVENTGKYTQWVRVKVTISDAAEWNTLFTDKGLELLDVFKGYDDTAWSRTQAAPEFDTNANTVTYVFYLNNKLEPGQKVTLFTGVQFPGEEFDQNDFATVPEFTMNFVAEAIQAEGTGTTAVEAFTHY